MIRIFLPFQIFFITALLVTCERHDMYELATLGQPPRTGLYLYYVNSPKNGNLGGREGADRICYQEGYAYHKFVQATTVKAFLSVSLIDEIRFLVPLEYWSFPVYGINPSFNFTEVSESWAGLWDGSINNMLQMAVGLPLNWWSGSNPDGSVMSGVTCGEWHNSDLSNTGEAGNQGLIIPGWISGIAQTCDTIQDVVCLAY
jgi:hypothetical protein